MKYLLDTHYIIWSVTETEKISKKIREILENPKNEILVSTISFWEISLKYSMGKLLLGEYIPENFPEACFKMGFESINLDANTCITYHHLLPKYHKDPFDRMLIAQAIAEDLTIITQDQKFALYEQSVKILWN